MTNKLLALEKTARAAEKSGDHESAFRAWQELASETRNAAFYCQLGRVARELGRWADAEKAFLDALTIDSHLAVAMLMIGSLFLARTDGARSGNAKLAKIWLLRALEIDRTAPGLTLLGSAHYSLGEKEAAKRAYSSAIELDDSYEEAYFNLAILEGEEGGDPQAERLLQRAIQTLRTTFLVCTSRAYWVTRGVKLRQSNSIERRLACGPARNQQLSCLRIT